MVFSRWIAYGECRAHHYDQFLRESVPVSSTAPGATAAAGSGSTSATSVSANTSSTGTPVWADFFRLRRYCDCLPEDRAVWSASLSPFPMTMSPESLGLVVVEELVTDCSSEVARRASDSAPRRSRSASFSFNLCSPPVSFAARLSEDERHTHRRQCSSSLASGRI